MQFSKNLVNNRRLIMVIVESISESVFEMQTAEN